MGFSHYIYENELTSENMYLPMNLAKKSQIHFSFFKADSQNPKFLLENLPNAFYFFLLTGVKLCIYDIFIIFT